MSTRIKLTPSELQTQAAEMMALQGELENLFGNVSSTLSDVNRNWSPLLSRNFQGKITSAQRTFSQITQDLMNGANVAKTCATTFQSVDSELAKLYSPAPGTTVNASTSTNLWDIIKEELSDIPDDMKTAGEFMAWLESQIDKLPDWATGGAELLWDFLVDDTELENFKDALQITSQILQGEMDLEAIWGTVSGILKGNTKLAIICETIDYARETGLARDAEMNAQLEAQIAEGDILGAIFDGAEGYIDTIGGGVVDVLGAVGGGILDHTPGVKWVSKVFEYGTGLLGINDGEGYTLGGLIEEGAHFVSGGIDAATDFITDTTDKVTSAITDAGKGVFNWFKARLD